MNTTLDQPSGFVGPLIISLIPSLSKSLAEQFNVFRVMHHGTPEKQISNVFAWLLRSDGTHGLGDTFERIFVEQRVGCSRRRCCGDALGRAMGVENTRVPEPLADLDYTRVFVTRQSKEQNSIDLILQSDAGLEDVLSGLTADDYRLRDAVVRAIRAD